MYRAILVITLALSAGASAVREVIPAVSTRHDVDPTAMQRIYEQVKTPYKYGIVLAPEPGKKVDCPSIFRHQGRWYMVYIIFDGRGYETALAVSDNLLHWRTLGKILRYQTNTWDSNQAAGYIALADTTWGGSYELGRHEGKYWLSYLGGAATGYEAGRLGIGMAWSREPHKPSPWTRIEANPVLSDTQEDARWWEKQKLFKSHIIADPDQSLGWPYIMYYNAKGPDGPERIGMAVSRDMQSWHRYGKEPVIDNKAGISGDPQITRIDNAWVMFYFGAFWRPKAFDTFACSHDLIHWTCWTGPDLIEPSEPWDDTYAHKPWVIRHEGVVYHFYCAVGDRGRTIALATSRQLRENP